MRTGKEKKEGGEKEKQMIPDDIFQMGVSHFQHFFALPVYYFSEGFKANTLGNILELFC